MTELKEDISEEWVELLIIYDSIEADMIKDLLESGGISVILKSA